MSTLLRIDIDEFERRVAAGVYDKSQRLELVRGEVREMSPIGNPHADALTVLLEWAHDHRIRAGFRVRCQSPLELTTTDSLLQPDMVLTPTRRYWTECPTASDAILVVEVADSSVAYDLGEKAMLFAQGGVRDYWVVDVLRREVIVHRRPSPQGYMSVVRHGRGDKVAPLAFADMELDIDTLFPAVEGSAKS